MIVQNTKKKKLLMGEMSMSTNLDYKKLIENMDYSGMTNFVTKRSHKELMKLRQICIDPNILFSNYDGEVIKMEKLLFLLAGIG